MHLVIGSSITWMRRQILLLPGTFLRHFIEYALLRGSGGTPPVSDQGLSPVAENGLRAFQRAKLSSKRHATEHH